jgi:hypothetical protein
VQDRFCVYSAQCMHCVGCGPPPCHFTAAPRWWPFPGSTCALALRGHDPLRKPAGHACRRGQGWVLMAFEANRSSCPCLLTHGYDPSAPPCSQVEISWCTGWRARFCCTGPTTVSSCMRDIRIERVQSPGYAKPLRRTRCRPMRAVRLLAAARHLACQLTHVYP